MNYNCKNTIIMFKDQRHYYLSGAKTFALAKQVHSVIVTKIFTAGLLNLDFTVIEYCELIAFTNSSICKYSY